MTPRQRGGREGASAEVTFVLDAISEDDDQMFYHGTDATSARSLFNGAALSVPAAASKTHGATLGFYLATDPLDAEFFGSLKGTHYAVIKYVITAAARIALMAGGAVLGPILQAGAPQPFTGLQLFIPMHVFILFDQLRHSAMIKVLAHR